MEFRVFVEPQQGATYEQLSTFARASEAAGFNAFFRSDHYQAMGSATGQPGPTDAWTTLAGLARDTSRIRLGTLVTSATFRLPGPLAISVAQVDHMSNGRVELGLGAGWYQVEHASYGIPFPPLKERFAKLEEQLSIITGLWTTPAGEHFSFDGRHYQVNESPALPKPLQSPRPPVIVGGGGQKTTPRLAATFADEFNTPFMQPDDAAAAFQRLDAACRDFGRDAQSIKRSSAMTVVCAKSPQQLEQRASAAGWKLEDLQKFGACGNPDEVAKRLAQWRDAGASRLYVQLLDLNDLAHVKDVHEACAMLA